MSGISIIVFIVFSGWDLSTAATVLKDTIDIYGSPNPVGSGARALGMGGAFIAVADDATAASWNPGGLIQLERPEVSVVGAFFDRTMDTRFPDFPEASGDHQTSEARLNYFSLSYPFFALGRNMTVSVNYQDLYDLNNQWNFPFSTYEEESITRQQVKGVQEGSLSAFGLAFCVEAVQNLSVGLTLNFWESWGPQDNRWEQTSFRQASGVIPGYTFTHKSYSKDTYEFSGFNINLGVMWNIASKWTLGAVLKTPFTADLVHRQHATESLVIEGDPIPNGSQNYSATKHETLDMPMSWGIGIAYRMSDRLTFSGDIYRTEWGDFVHTNAYGDKLSPITGTGEDQADIDPTHQIRLGVEYLFINPKYVIPLRGGLFYDPLPAKGTPDDCFGISLGSGIAYKRYIFDIAFQYRFAKDVGGFGSQSLEYSQDVQEITIYSSLIIHF